MKRRFPMFLTLAAVGVLGLQTLPVHAQDDAPPPPPPPAEADGAGARAGGPVVLVVKAVNNAVRNGVSGWPTASKPR